MQSNQQIEEVEELDQECGGFNFADVSKDNEIHGNFSNSAPNWRIVVPGFNLEGKCQHRGCEAFGQRVCIPIGKTNKEDGTQKFSIAEVVCCEEYQRCPMSPADENAAGFHRLGEDDLNNVILSRCEWELEHRLDQPQAKKETRKGKTEKDFLTWDVTT